MAYRQAKTNIRRAPRRRRASVRRAPVRRRRRVVRSKRSRAVSQCHCPGEATPGQKFILAQADPFEPKCNGGKIPDSSTIPSISTPIQYNLTLTSSSETTAQPRYAAAWAFMPAATNCNKRANGFSTSSWTWDGASNSPTSIPNLAGFVTQFEATRTIAHGIRLTCPFAPTGTTGFVHIALATETYLNGTSGATTDVWSQLATNFSEMSQYTFYKRVTLASLTQSPLTLINKWTDETAFRYGSPNVDYGRSSVTADAASTVFHVPLNWGILLVAVEGASTSTTAGSTISPLTAEVVWHTENIPNKSSTVVGTTAAPSQPEVLSAVSQAVAGTDFAHTEAQQESSMQSFASELMNAAGISSADVQAVAGGLLRQVTRAGVGYIAQRYGIGGVNDRPNRLAIM
ncbi:MAG: capsid protein [Cressdnaviricota sp.]|nr:MAG: capsid protein [Cressdnaviricota sp.]